MALNSDCANLIFNHLSPQDIYNCTLVSWLWRGLAHEWIALYGGGRDLRVNNNCSDDDEKIGDYKDCVRLGMGLRSGRRPPLSIAYPSTLPRVQFAGQYAAWVDGGSILWHTIPPTHLRKKVRIPDFHYDDVFYLGLNAEGYILARVRRKTYTCGWKQKPGSLFSISRVQHTRDVVVSLPKGKVVWSLDHANSIPAITPLAIGKERVYFGTGHQLSAFDFGTGHLLYDRLPITTIIPDFASPSGPSHHPASIPNRFQVFQHKNYEFLIRGGDYRPLVHVIDGSSGRQVLKLTFPGFVVESVVMTPEYGVFTVKARCHAYSLLLLQQYRLQSDGSFARTRTDARQKLFGETVLNPHPFAPLAITGAGSETRCQNLNFFRRSNIDGIQHIIPGGEIDRFCSLSNDAPLTMPSEYPNRVGWELRRKRSLDTKPLWGAVFIDRWRLLLFFERRDILVDFTPRSGNTEPRLIAV